MGVYRLYIKVKWLSNLKVVELVKLKREMREK